MSYIACAVIRILCEEPRARCTQTIIFLLIDHACVISKTAYFFRAPDPLIGRCGIGCPGILRARRCGEQLAGAFDVGSAVGTGVIDTAVRLDGDPAVNERVARRATRICGTSGCELELHILPRPCPCCGGRMIIIETFERRSEAKCRPTPTPVTIRIDTS